MEDREKLLSFISYFFGWISGLIIFLTEKKSEYIKFNAMQSIIFSGVWTGCYIFASLISFLPIPFLSKIISFLLFSIIYIGGFVIWVILLVKAFQKEYFRVMSVFSHQIYFF